MQNNDIVCAEQNYKQNRCLKEISLHVIKKIVDVDGRFSTSNNDDLGNFRNEFITILMVIAYLYVFNISTVRCLKLYKCKMRTCIHRTCEWGKRTMLIIL